MKVLAKGFADSLFPTVLLLLLSLRGSKLISVGKSVRFVPWAGVRTASRGEVGTLLSQERDVMEENVTS